MKYVKTLRGEVRKLHATIRALNHVQGKWCCVWVCGCGCVLYSGVSVFQPHHMCMCLKNVFNMEVTRILSTLIYVFTVTPKAVESTPAAGATGGAGGTGAGSPTKAHKNAFFAAETANAGPAGASGGASGGTGGANSGGAAVGGVNTNLNTTTNTNTNATNTTSGAAAAVVNKQ